MRLKVRINVTDPLKQSWKVRANEGNYVQIIFKYEKLGIFCYLCGVLGHTDKNCNKLFDIDHDDGTRGWGENLRPLITRVGTSATNKYLKDPIPSRPQNMSASGTGIPSAAAPTVTPHDSTPISVNLDGRIVAVQKEISAIKSGLLIAQKQAMVKAGKLTHEASPSHTAALTFATSSPAVCDTARNRPIVLGLLAEPHIQVQDADLLCLEDAETEDNGAELKKRKRAKAVKSQTAEDTICSGSVGLAIDVTRQGNGIDDVVFVDNPMYDANNVMLDANNVMAGPDDLACREP
jgi:hypothetical protein